MVWRLIYSGSRVIDLFNTNGTTYTPHNIYNGVDIYDCFSKIDELEYYYEYPTGDTQTIIFSGGTRNIVDNT